MTRRTVVWVAEAEAVLSQIWLASSSREHVTMASHSIDSVLGQDAESAGNLLIEGLRAFYRRIESLRCDAFARAL